MLIQFETFHLWKLYLRADVERVCEIPLEDQVVCCVRKRLNHHKTDLSNEVIKRSPPFVDFDWSYFVVSNTALKALNNQFRNSLQILAYHVGSL